MLNVYGVLCSLDVFCIFQVSSVAFSSDGSMFVTVGMRHVKFWYLDSSRSKVGAAFSISLDKIGIVNVLKF